MKRIRVILIILAFLALGLSVGSFVEYKGRDGAERAAYFQGQERARARGEITFSGPYCTPDRHPTRLLSITILIALALGFLIFFENPLWSMLLSIGALLNFPLWFWWTREAIGLAETTPVAGLELYLYRAGGFDVAVGVLVSTIVCIQFVILLLSLRRSRFLSAKLP